MGMYNVILKLGFRRAFNAAVNGNTEDSKRRRFTMHLLSFLVEIKKVFFSSSA